MRNQLPEEPEQQPCPDKPELHEIFEIIIMRMINDLGGRYGLIAGEDIDKGPGTSTE